MEQYGASWHYMAPYGTIWTNIAPYGTIWTNMAYYGNTDKNSPCMNRDETAVRLGSLVPTVSSDQTIPVPLNTMVAY